MKRPAVFFDRDNTLIACDGYLGDPAKVELIEGAAEAIARVRELGFAVAVFSNQSGVARGMYGEDAVHAVNHRMDDLLREEDPQAIIDRHDFCPYHPTAIVERYRVDSELRKPRPGMIYQAAAVLGLDLSRSWVVGDAPRDIAAGHTAGLRTVLLKIASLPPSPATNEGAGVEPDFIATSLAEAIDFIEENRVVPEERVTEEIASGQWKDAQVNEVAAVGVGAGVGERAYHPAHQTSSNGHWLGGETDAALGNLHDIGRQSDRIEQAAEPESEQGEEAFLDGALPEAVNAKLAEPLPESPASEPATSEPVSAAIESAEPAASEPNLAASVEVAAVSEVQVVTKSESGAEIAGPDLASESPRLEVPATELGSSELAAATLPADVEAEPTFAVTTEPLETVATDAELVAAEVKSEETTIAPTAGEAVSSVSESTFAEQAGTEWAASPEVATDAAEPATGESTIATESVAIEPEAAGVVAGSVVAGDHSAMAPESTQPASVPAEETRSSLFIKRTETAYASPDASEDPLKLTPRPSYKHDPAKPVRPPEASSVPSADSSRQVQGGFVVRPNQAPQMTWGERMRMAKGSGVVWPNGKPAGYDDPDPTTPEPEPVAEATPEVPVAIEEPEPLMAEPVAAYVAAPATPVESVVAAAEPIREAESTPAEPAQEPKRGLRREELAAQEVAMNDPDPADATAEKSSRRVSLSAGIRDGSRSEELLEQILIELRRKEEQASLDFSVSKLLAGITQVLALAAMFFAYLAKDTNNLEPMLLVAQVLQTLTISLLIMGRQK